MPRTTAAREGGKPVWLMMLYTMCDGDIPAEWGGDNLPFFYASEADATKALAEEMADEWQAVKDGERDPEDVNEFWIERGEWNGERLVMDSGREWTEADFKAVR